MFTLPVLVFTGLTFVLAGFVKGVVGLGLPTIAMGLLSTVVLPAQAAALLIVPSLVTNVWQAFGSEFRQLVVRLWRMLAGVILGTLAGANLMTADTRPSIALGFALMLYAGIGLAAIRLSVSPKTERWLSAIVGVTTGLITAATGVFVIPAVPYLQALGLQREELVQALGLSFTVSTLALAANLARSGAFQTSAIAASSLALIPALAGMVIGQWVLARMSPKTFRLCFFLGLLALGAHLASQVFG